MTDEQPRTEAGRRLFLMGPDYGTGNSGEILDAILAIEAEARATRSPDAIAADVAAGLADVAAGRTRSWDDIKSEMDAASPSVALDVLERAAQIAEGHAERLKHTSHRDGLGMGWQAGEELCREIAELIRSEGTDR